MQTFRLTDRLETEVATFASVLASTPDHILQDLFSGQPPKQTKPYHWISQPHSSADLYPEEGD